MDYELIDKLHKLADVIEHNDNIHCDSTVRRAAYTIERLYKENEQYKARLLILYPTPKEYALRIIGYFYFKYIMLKKKLTDKSTGKFFFNVQYWTMKAKQ